MQQMMRNAGTKVFLRQELPSGAVAFVLAEVYYKFHSFSLECVAFLGTWLVLSYVWGSVLGAAGRMLPSRGAVRGDK